VLLYDYFTLFKNVVAFAENNGVSFELNPELGYCVLGLVIVDGVPST